jgi:hypothetical protein
VTNFLTPTVLAIFGQHLYIYKLAEFTLLIKNESFQLLFRVLKIPSAKHLKGTLSHNIKKVWFSDHKIYIFLNIITNQRQGVRQSF